MTDFDTKDQPGTKETGFEGLSNSVIVNVSK